MAFPPAENYFNVPSELIHGCYLFSREVVSVRSNPIHLVIDTVANYPQFLLCLVDSGSAKQYHGIVKNYATRFDCVGFYAGLFCIAPDTACKGLLFCLPEIKIFMTLVVAVHDSGLTRQKYLADKRTFIRFAISEKYFCCFCLQFLEYVS